MSAFLGSKIVAKATPVVAKRDVTVRAASASECVPTLGGGAVVPSPRNFSRAVGSIDRSSDRSRLLRDWSPYDPVRVVNADP